MVDCSKILRIVCVALTVSTAVNAVEASDTDKKKSGVYHATYSGERIDVGKRGVVCEKIADLPRYDAADGTRRVVQAMDICNGYAFVGFDGGYCRTIRMSDMKVIAEFPLGSNVASNHCGNLDFGVEIPDGSEFPALYVSGDLSTFSCYVERVSEKSAELIQTIKFELGNGYNGSQVVIDRESRSIFYMQRKLKSINVDNNTIVIYKFRLPLLTEGDVTFGESDVEAVVELPVWLRLYQGATIVNNKLFEVNGICRDESPSAKLSVFDIRTGALSSEFDLSFVDREPQGVSVYNGALYINFQDSMWRLTFE